MDSHQLLQYFMEIHLKVAALKDGPAGLVGHLDAIGLLRSRERGLAPPRAVLLDLNHPERLRDVQCQDFRVAETLEPFLPLSCFGK
jgi:hypothetical protein